MVLDTVYKGNAQATTPQATTPQASQVHIIACFDCSVMHLMRMPPAQQRRPPNNMHATNIQPINVCCIGVHQV